MANNITVKDGSGTSTTLQTTDNTNVHVPAHQIVRSDGTVPLKPVAEDAAHSSGDSGIVAMCVRADSAACPAGSDGDYAPPIVDANGKLWVNSQVTAVVPGTGATALGKAEDAAHSSGDVGVMALAVRQSTATDLSAGNTNGDYEPLQVDASGRLWVNAGAVGTITPGTAASSLGKAEDAAHSSGDVGVMSLAVRNATATDLSAGNTDGDYEPLQVDASGRLWVNAGALTPGTAAANLGKAEDAAHSSGDVGVMALAVRRATATDLSAGNTDGDYEPLEVDASGRLWTHVGAIDAGSATIGNVKDAGPSWTSVYGVSGEAVSSSDASSPVPVTDAPTEGQKLVITDLVVSSAAALTLTFTEETSGDVLLVLYMAANSTVNVNLRGKLKLAVADKQLLVGASGAGNISVLAGYYSEA